MKLALESLKNINKSYDFTDFLLSKTEFTFSRETMYRQIHNFRLKILILQGSVENQNLDDIKRNFRILHEVDVKQCLGVIFKKAIQIYGARNHESFYALPTEETLSESMMMNNSVALGQHEKFHQTFNTIGQVSR